LEDIIVKYLTDSITSEERAKLRAWLSSTKNQEIFKEFVKDNHRLDVIYNDTLQVENTFKKIQEEVTSKKVIPLKNTYRFVFKYAAIFIIALSSFFIYKSINSYPTINTIDLKNHIVLQLNEGVLLDLTSYNSNKILNKEGELIATLTDNKLTYKKSKSASSVSNHKLSVPNGKTFTVVLSDNTEIMMNSGSTLKYSSNFSNGINRKVFLKGEAYFEVTKNKKSPFIVHTKEMNVKVLGTKFNVSNYQNDRNATVVLEEGSVSVNKPTETNPTKKIILKPKQQLILQDGTFIVKEVVVKKHIAWKKRQLHFKNDRFEDIIKELERYYDISITLNSSDLNEIRYTGSFTTESIIEVLDMFKELSEFKYAKDSNRISITKIEN